MKILKNLIARNQVFNQGVAKPISIVKRVISFFGIILFSFIGFWYINFTSAWSVTFTWNASYSFDNTSWKIFYRSNSLWNNNFHSVWLKLTSSYTTLKYTCTFSNLQYSNLDFLNLFSSSLGSLRVFTIVKNTSYFFPGGYYTTSTSYDNFNKSLVDLLDNWTLTVSNSFGYSDFIYNSFWISPTWVDVNFSSVDCSSVACSFSFDYSCTIDYNDSVFKSSSIISNSLNDCSSVENDLQTCQSSLTTCQSELSTCQNQTTCDRTSTVQSLIDTVSSWTASISEDWISNFYDFWTSPNKTVCIKITNLQTSSTSRNKFIKIWFYWNKTALASDSQEFWFDQAWQTVCLYANKRYFNFNSTIWDVSFDYEFYYLNDLYSEKTCILDNWYTQAQCESEYSLIPESSINSEYCEDRFNLIYPENCPSSWWTWDVNWSSFFVNSHQVQGAANVYLRLPEFLNWDYIYIDSWTTLEVNVENMWDEDYLNNILEVQTYHPSSEDFTQSFTWNLTLLMPYIIICLFVLFIWRLIRWIFK